MFLTSTMNNQIGNMITSLIGAGLGLSIIAMIISLAVFCLYVAVGTWVVKKVWFSDWGGNPRRYR